MNKSKIYSFLKDGITKPNSRKMIEKAVCGVYNCPEALYLFTTAAMNLKVVKLPSLNNTEVAVLMNTTTPAPSTAQTFLSMFKSYGIEEVSATLRYSSTDALEKIKPAIPLLKEPTETISIDLSTKIPGYIIAGTAAELYKVNNFTYADFCIEKALKYGSPIYQSDKGYLYFIKSYKDYTLMSVEFSVKGVAN